MHVLKAVDFVSSSLLANPNHTWSIGPLGHALHSLVIFHQRLYKDPTFAPKSELAAEPLRTKVRTTGTDLMPPEPECEARIDMTIEQLQRLPRKPRRCTQIIRQLRKKPLPHPMVATMQFHRSLLPTLP